MDFVVELIHELKILQSAMFNNTYCTIITSLTTNLPIIETVIFPKSLKIVAHEYK